MKRHLKGYLYSGHYAAETLKGSERNAEQLVGHIVEVYQFGNLHWHRWDDQFLQPAGISEKVYEIDFGELVAELDIQEYVRRKRNSRRAQLFLPPRFQPMKGYLSLELQRQDGDIWYGFDIKRNAISLERPLEYRITEYSSVDYERIDERKVKVITLARRVGNSVDLAGSFRLYSWPVPKISADLN